MEMTISTIEDRIYRAQAFVRLRAEGINHFAIATKYGIRPKDVAEEIQWYIGSYSHGGAGELVAVELEKLDSLERFVRNKLSQKYYLRNKNGDRVMDLVRHEDGRETLEPVEDYKATYAGVDAALRIMERRAKLLGLDSAESINRQERSDEKVIIQLSKDDLKI